LAIGPWKTRLKISAANLLAATVGRLAGAPGRLRILVFHDVGDDGSDLFAVTKRRLADYLSLLKDQGYTTVRAGDLAAAGPAALSGERLAVLTFDDAYAAQRDIAAELLAQHGMTATFFVISSFLSQDRSRCVFAGKQHDFLGAEDLRQMALAGFEIGSHSHTHALCGTLSPDQVEREAALSKQILQQELGRPVTAFAYPYGRQRAFSGATRAALQKSGYATAFTVEGTRVGQDCDPLRLPRTCIGRFDTPATFRRKLHGCYDFIGRVRKYGG
jgi:peptidoglycan/xylan/chitin deacetylase (PgdA/CDA1 family)